MQKLTTIMGTACVFATAALTAGPAAAAPLTDFAGTLTSSFGMTDNSESSGDEVKSWLLGGSFAAPLSDIAQLNVQADAAYVHNWADGFSREDWNFGGSAFWAGMDGRLGANFSYWNFNRFGHITNGGAFGEWYFGVLTMMAKGGWLSSGGSGIGGHGNYLGGAVEGYVMPDLGITGGVEWMDLVTGQGCQICGRGDVRATIWTVAAEFLFDEGLGLAGFASYSYHDNKFFNFESNDNAWRVGLRWYTGGGALIDRHRNGTLNPWLPSINASGLTF